MDVIDRVRGKIVDYDEKTQDLIIRVHYPDFPRLCRREYKEADVILKDSRPLSDKQRRCCYALINAISDWSGHEPDRIKEAMKFRFITENLQDEMDYFSLSNAAMSVVAAFQKFLARFCVEFEVPTKKPLLDYVDDVDDYLYSCLVNKKCPICGMHADLHHVTAVGMGRDRTQIIHEGMEVMPLCREHHTEMHTIGKNDFFKKYHFNNGIIADRTICKIYGLKRKKAV